MVKIQNGVKSDIFECALTVNLFHFRVGVFSRMMLRRKWWSCRVMKVRVVVRCVCVWLLLFFLFLL